MNDFKSFIKSFGKNLIKSKILIVVILIILILFVLIPSFFYFITIEDGIYKEDDWGSTTYGASTYTNSITIGENGLTSNTTAQDVWDRLIKEGSNVDEYLDSPEELEKLMNAEVITQYPKIGNGLLDGIIEFKRNKEDGSSMNLTYIDKKTFDNYISTNDTSIVNYFTLDDSGNALVGIVNKEIYELSSDDNELSLETLEEEEFSVQSLVDSDIQSDGTYYKQVITVTSKAINYKSVIEKYTMPFQYLWSLLVISDDKEFVLELADLAYDSEIVISIYDNVTTSVQEREYTYNKETRIDKYAQINVEKNYGATGYPTERYWISKDSPNADEYYNSDYETDEYITSGKFTVNLKNTIITNEFVYDLTKADVWIVDYSKEYTYQENGTTSSDSNSKTLNDTEYIYNETASKNSNGDNSLLNDEDAITFASSIKKYIEKYLKNQSLNDSTSSNTISTNSIRKNISTSNQEQNVNVDVKYVEYSNYDKKKDREISMTNVSTTKKYVAGNVVSNPKVEKNDKKSNFVNILCAKEHSDARQLITQDITSWLFELLEQNPSTVNMIDLTKYLLYKVTDRSYGVTDYDFDIYTENEFVSVEGSGSSGSDQLIRYIHILESGASPKMNSDGTKYIVEDDGAGNPTVGYGVDIFNSGYSSLFVDAGYSTQMGAEIDVEFVDSIEQMELEETAKFITSKVSGLNLTQYQINALISRAYNCGKGGAIKERNGKTFVEAYNAYWKAEDDQFEQKNSSANFNHQLYTTYMNIPITAKDKVLPGLIKRRKSEWTLFQTGYYDVLDEWHSDKGTIVETAKNIHEYMEKNKYTYCVYGGNSYEECEDFGKSHGLNITFEESKTGHKNSCCATFVSWVLQETGYLSDSEHTDSANSLQTVLKNKGFLTINNETELEPGDILCYDHHVEIYAGDNTIYNAGSGKVIRSASPQKRSRKFDYALRAPN